MSCILCIFHYLLQPWYAIVIHGGAIIHCGFPVIDFTFNDKSFLIKMMGKFFINESRVPCAVFFFPLWFPVLTRNSSERQIQTKAVDRHCLMKIVESGRRECMKGAKGKVGAEKPTMAREHINWKTDKNACMQAHTRNLNPPLEQVYILIQFFLPDVARPSILGQR